MITFDYGLGMFIYNISALIVIALITYKVLSYVSKERRKREHFNKLQANTFSVVLYDRVKFNHLKLLMSTKEVNAKIGLAMLNPKWLN